MSDGIVTIATSADPHFSQTVTLDGTAYILRFAYNQREQAYYVSIQNPVTGVDILSGIKLVSNFPLIRRYSAYDGLPPGELMAISNTSDDSPAKVGELGENGRVTLMYIGATVVGTQ